jgi:hypothetical protein
MPPESASGHGVGYILLVQLKCGAYCSDGSTGAPVDPA